MPSESAGHGSIIFSPPAVYFHTQLKDKAVFRDFVIEIVRRIAADPVFKVLSRRWLVQRTFGWLIRWRRLVRDYEQGIDVSEATFHVAMRSLLLRRIIHWTNSERGSQRLGIIMSVFIGLAAARAATQARMFSGIAHPMSACIIPENDRVKHGDTN